MSEPSSPLRQCHEDPKDYVKGVLAMLCPDGSAKLDGSIRPEVAAFRQALRFYVLEDPDGGKDFRLDEARLPWLREQAERDPSAFDALTSLGKLYVGTGHPLPEIIRSHVLAILDGTARRPHRRRTKNWRRDKIIAVLVSSVASEYGRNATRNDETRDRRSACDIVAEAFSEFGFRGVGYDVAKGAYYANR